MNYLFHKLTHSRMRRVSWHFLLFTVQKFQQLEKAVGRACTELNVVGSFLKNSES